MPNVHSRKLLSPNEVLLVAVVFGSQTRTMLPHKAVALYLLLPYCSLADVPFHRKDVIGKPKARKSNRGAAASNKNKPITTSSSSHENQKKKTASNLLSTEALTDTLMDAVQHNTTTKSSQPTKQRSTSSSKRTVSMDHTQKTRKIRLQREWKDAVAAGIAFDWKKRKPVCFQTPQVIWLGPISNLNEWHFSFVGLGDPYGTGLYHGILKLPSDYPARPPKIQVWTPNGRFQTHRDLCLDVSNYHPESWKPNLTIRSIVESVRVHMMTPADNAIGSLGDSYHQRRDYAEASRTYSYERNDALLLVHHAEMIRKGWILGMTEQQTSDGVESSQDLVVTSESGVTLSSLLMTRPKLLIIVGAFCILFVFLNSR